MNADAAQYATVSTGNLFAYCENDPLNYVDFWGHAPSLYTLTKMHNAVVASAQKYLWSRGIITSSEVLTCQIYSITGRMDIYSYTHNMVWEVKRNNTLGRNAGINQLNRYVKSYVYSLYHSWLHIKRTPQRGTIPVYGAVTMNDYLVTYHSDPSTSALILYDYMTLRQAAEILYEVTTSTSAELAKLFAGISNNAKKKATVIITRIASLLRFGIIFGGNSINQKISKISNFLKQANPEVLGLVAILILVAAGIPIPV